MPDWTGSFHMPTTSTEQFQARQAAYVAKHGYRYSVPGFDNIFKLGFEKPMTKEEEQIWKNGEYSKFSPERYEELKYTKEKRKEAYLNMLGSPQPQIFQSRGTLIGSIDDAQDAMATLATVGSVALPLLPAAVRTLCSGPLSALFTASEILNIINTTMTPEKAFMKFKQKVETRQKNNPKDMKLRQKSALRVKTAKIGQPTIIEALQVTDNVFGVGLGLGALMNLPLDIITGTARQIMGDKVTWHYWRVNTTITEIRARKVAAAIPALLSSGYETVKESCTLYTICANAAAQLNNFSSREENPLDHVKDVNNFEMQAPKPTNILSIEAIQEVDPEGLNAIQWPTTGQEWSNPNDLMDSMADPINQTFNEYQRSEQYTDLGRVGAVNATEAVLHTYEAAEGPGSVFIDYSADTKAVTGLMNAGYIFPKDITPAQFVRWQNYTDSLEFQGISPALKSSLHHAKTVAGFDFVQQVDFYK